MNEKTTFGAYLLKKRQDLGLTQKELAQRLYVAESTISKWERGLSYPDISMVSPICSALGISEQEFFTACDDDQSQTQARQARAWRRTTRGLWWLLAAGYAVALLSCFICNLAIFHTLSWFWIVLFSIALAFSLTNLPLMLSQNRVPICLGTASGSLLLLLLACWAYAGGWWVLGGAAITLTCLALPWSWWALWRFYGKHLPELFGAAFSLWLFPLLAVIRAFTGGSWLFSVAYPVAAFGVVFLWAFFAVVRWLPAGPWLKAGLCALLVTFVSPLCNCFLATLLPGQVVNVPTSLGDYFDWGVILTRESADGFSWINVLVFAVMLGVSVLLLAAGIRKEVCRRKK